VKCIEEINDARERDHLSEQLHALHRRVAEAYEPASTGCWRNLPFALPIPTQACQERMLLEPLFDLLAVPAAQGACFGSMIEPARVIPTARQPDRQ